MRSLAIVGLVLVSLLSLAFAGYTVLSPHTTTVTQQQFVTNTQNLVTTQTQTQTVTSQTVATSLTTVMNSIGNGYGNYQNYQVCGNYGCYNYPSYYDYPMNPGYYYYNNGYYSYNPGSYYSNYPYYYGCYNGAYTPPCQGGSNGNVTCSGYLYNAGNGCTVLTIPTISNPYPSYATGDVLEYITLHNLPSNTPSGGTWVTVTGQLYKGPNTSSSGQSCPDNYIVVSSIS
jgi:hypothetical protein